MVVICLSSESPLLNVETSVEEHGSEYLKMDLYNKYFVVRSKDAMELNPSVSKVNS